MHAAKHHKCKCIIDIITSLAIFFAQSPKRSSQLDDMVKVLELPSLSMVIPGDTWWLSILRSISCVLHHYKAIVVAQENIAHIESGETSAKAKGYRAVLLSFETLFLLLVRQKILEPLDRLNLGLQTSCMDAIDSLVVSRSTIRIVRAIDIEAVALCKDLEEGELK